MATALFVVAAWYVITFLSNMAKIINSIGKPPAPLKKPARLGTIFAAASVIQAAAVTVIVLAAFRLSA